jgi:hypothetical protein
MRSAGMSGSARFTPRAQARGNLDTGDATADHCARAADVVAVGARRLLA